MVLGVITLIHRDSEQVPLTDSWYRAAYLTAKKIIVRAIQNVAHERNAAPEKTRCARTKTSRASKSQVLTSNS
jgi:hypothetical protein